MTKKATFTITRDDGRSNTQVLLDHVAAGEPGHVYPYGELVDALSAGTNHVYTVDAVRQVVAAAQPRMLKEQQRTLHNVRTVGYRLAAAREHVPLALARKRRADKQEYRALLILRNVHYDEMDENTRNAHMGHLMLAEALAANQAALERRMRNMESAIASLKGQSA